MPTRPTNDDRRKLKAEADLAELQVREHGRQNRMNLYRNIATFVTTLVAVSGLFFSIYQQHQQYLQLAEQRIDDAFNKDLQQLESSKDEGSKLIALTKLATYFKPEYPSYREQLSGLMVNYAGLDSSDAILKQLHKILVANASPDLVNLLAEQNRTLQTTFGEHLHFQSKQLSFFADSLFYGRPANLALVRLDWNIRTLIQCLNRMGGIDHADLSRLVLSRNSVDYADMGGSDQPAPKTYLDSLNRLSSQLRSAQLKDSLHFREVNFARSKLCGLTFGRDTLDHVRFDGCNLIGTHFYSCLIIDNSLYNFIPVASFDYPGKGLIYLIDSPPFWQDCTGNFSEFVPSPSYEADGSRFRNDLITKDIQYFRHSQLIVAHQKGHSAD